MLRLDAKTVCTVSVIHVCGLVHTSRHQAGLEAEHLIRNQQAKAWADEVFEVLCWPNGATLPVRFRGRFFRRGT